MRSVRGAMRALLAALANQTGGNLYVDEAMVLADDAEGVSVERANEENLRRGATIGATLADWTRATVIWPEQVALADGTRRRLSQTDAAVADRSRHGGRRLDRSRSSTLAIAVQIARRRWRCHRFA